MLHILIADDHPDQVAGLKQILLAGLEGELEIHEAYDGFEALEIVKSRPVDIAVTDIRMPGMDGLELSRNIRLLSPRTGIVILSGYAQFEYAQRALEYRVTNYLLKPVESSQLLQCVEAVVSRLAKRDDDDRMIYAYKENKQLLIGGFLLDLLGGKLASAAQAEKKLRALELAVPDNRRMYLLAVRMEGRFLQYNQYDVSIMEFAVRNLFEEMLGERWAMLSCKDANDDLVFAVYGKGGSIAGFDELERHARRLQEQVEKLLKGRISVVASQHPAAYPEEIVGKYEALVGRLRRLDSRIEGNWELVGDGLSESPVGGDGIESLYEAPLLYRLFETRQWGQAGEKLEAIFEEMERKRLFAFAHRQEVFYGVTSAFAYVAHRNGIELAELTERSSLSPAGAHEFRSNERLQDWIMELFGLIRERLGNAVEKNAPSLIERVAEFVESHLSRDLSLQTIADHVGLHPVYLSRIFKLETGSGLSVYLLKVRMEKAAQLLADTDLKIYQIASRLGYLTPHYFIKLFKEHYGTTPQEYREHL